MVNKLFLYLLVFTMLCENNILTEMLKAPFLVAHFMEHHHQNASIGIGRFLSMHYLGQDIGDNDTNKDMKLPFKKMNIHSHLVLFQMAVKAYALFKESYTNRSALSYLYRRIKDPLPQEFYKPPRV